MLRSARAIANRVETALLTLDLQRRIAVLRCEARHRCPLAATSDRVTGGGACWSAPIRRGRIAPPRTTLE